MGRPGGSMKPCKFFLQGSCRNGNNCRFSHESYSHSNGNSGGFGSQRMSPFGNNGGGSASNTQGVAMTESGRALAIEELKLPPIWPLSGFSVAKGLPSVVAGDVSPEEARWEAYQEFKMMGNCTQSTQKLQALVAEQQNQRHRVVLLLENNQSAPRLFAGQSLLDAAGLNGQGGMDSPFGGGEVASPFGAGAAASPFRSASPFRAGAAASPFKATAAPNPFGGGTASLTSPFNGAAPTNAGPHAFKGDSTTFGHAANPFGGGPAPAATLFGRSATLAPSPFRAASATAFGGTVAPSTTLCSTSKMAVPFKSGTVAFEPGEAETGYSSVSPFGGKPATPAAPPSLSGAAPAPGYSPLGLPTSSPFSSSAATTFGGSSVGCGTFSTPFGASTLSSTFPSSFQAPASSPFGAQTAPASTVSGFQKPAVGNVPTTVPHPPPALEKFTGLPPDLRDDAWNMEQFQLPEFTLGMVPTVPPPLQFC